MTSAAKDMTKEAEKKNESRREIDDIGGKEAMNHRVLLWLIAIALLATVGCRPRHPPHTPQPLNMKDALSGSASVNEK
jgi:hypothetical protein